jgi:hypothetical protein
VPPSERGRHRRSIGIPVLVGPMAVAMLFHSAIASAQDLAAAEALFRDGKNLMKAGDYAKACPKFIASQRIDPSAGTALNLAACHQKEGKTATAWADYLAAARMGKEQKNPAITQEATSRAAEIERELSHLTVRAPQGAAGLEITRDGAPLDAGSLDSKIPVDPGPHQIRAQSPGYRPYEVTVTVGAARDDKVVAIPPLEREAAAVPVIGAPVAQVAPPVAVQTAPVPPPAAASIETTAGPSTAPADTREGSSKGALGSVAGARATPQSAKSVEGSIGLKLAVGHNIWTEPSDIPPGHDGAYAFAGAAGGLGYGFGLYGELRFARVFGIEIGVAYDKSTISHPIADTYGGPPIPFEGIEKFTVSSLRIPFIVKGIVPLPFGRLSVGVGPEIITPLSADGNFEFTGGLEDIAMRYDAGRILGRVWRASIVQPARSLLLTTDLGLAIALPGSLEIPIDLRASKNLSQSSVWEDRLTYDSAGHLVTAARISWDLRFLTGLGVRF